MVESLLLPIDDSFRVEELQPHYYLRGIEPETAIRENTPLFRTWLWQVFTVLLGSYLRGSGDVETALVLDMEHQITSIQVLHDKEEVFLCKRVHERMTSVICQVCSKRQSF